MSFEVPSSIESQVRRVAVANHISSDEALLQIIEAGLKRMLPSNEVSPRDILGAFSSPEEIANVDAALALAMQDRDRQNSQMSDA